MMNKIQVLLIDDLPTFALKKAKDTTLKGIESYQKESDVPFIAVKPYSEYFKLKWLQNKEDLQLYKKLCRGIEDNFSASDLGSVEGAVSEIVLFDYALTGHEDASYLSEEYDNNLLEQLVPKYSLAQYWKEQKNEDNLPLVERIKINSTQISEGLNDDNIGCIGGIIVVTQFRTHPCIGIATSRKTDANIQGKDVQFLEYLVKEPNQFDFGLRGDISNLKWETLLNNAVNLLRKRIEILLQSNKITLNLAQLLAYANEIPSKQEERIFTFQSSYGIRHLPLDGLFIDEPTDSRDTKIKIWITTLLGNFKTDAYVTAKQISKTLIDAYKGSIVEQRMLLSELAIKLCNGETLSEQEENDLSNLKSEFEISDNDIEKIKNKDIKKINLNSSKIFDYRDLTKDKTELEKRLVVLFTELRIYLVWQEFKKKNQKSTYNQDVLSLLSSVPTFSELRAALYPVPKNPLILDYHREQLCDKSILNKNLFESWEKPLGEHLNKPIYSKNEYPMSLTEGEKILSRSFTMEIGLESSNYPNWLNKK